MARQRKKKEDEPENLERWLVSYADFITLLFAFFVVMYALSVVNEGKYRLLSNSIVAAFNKNPVQVEVTPIASTGVPQIMLNKPSVAINPKYEEEKRQTKSKMSTIAREVMDALGPLAKEGQVRVTEGLLGVTIEINASLLFSPGEARLAPGAAGALSSVAQVLVATDFPILVEGHSDNLPISTPQFPSNWELSGARASSVVRLFIDSGVAARRLTATGYADQRPVEDNATPEGRGRNRRVAITIESRRPDTLSDVPVLPAQER
ncbi:MAG: flagellar motor protein MotD [Proteobacteria bacterium]|nr:flagellar motor protein MotD [Pseudomonadota bacterium]